MADSVAEVQVFSLFRESKCEKIKRKREHSQLAGAKLAACCSQTNDATTTGVREQSTGRRSLADRREPTESVRQPIERSLIKGLMRIRSRRQRRQRRRRRRRRSERGALTSFNQRPFLLIVIFLIANLPSHSTINASRQSITQTGSYGSYGRLAGTPSTTESPKQRQSLLDRLHKLEEADYDDETVEQPFLPPPVARYEGAKYYFSLFNLRAFEPGELFAPEAEPLPPEGSPELLLSQEMWDEWAVRNKSHAGSNSTDLPPTIFQPTNPIERPYFGDFFSWLHDVYWPIHCIICLLICTLGIFANVTNIIVLTR